MSFRFRKSFKIAPGVRLNLSKSGIGMSAGVRGARVGVNSRGTYTSVGIPGTGISSINYHSYGKKSSGGKMPIETSIPSRAIQTKSSSGIGWFVLINLILVVINFFVGVTATILSICIYQLYLKKQPSYLAKKSLRDAENAYKAGKYEEAAIDFENAYNSFPNDKALALLVASANGQLGKYDKSIRFARDYVETYPSDYEIQEMLARWHAELGDKDKALQILQSLPVEETKDSVSLLLMSNILSDKGLYDSAIDVLKRAPLTKRILTPDLVEIIYSLGLLYEKTGDKRRAKSSFERVYAYDANFKDVAVKTGELK